MPHISEAALDVSGSAEVRNTRVRNDCNSVFQASPRVALFREEIDCVATIGTTRDWRVRGNAFSSPCGSSSPTTANDWYSSQTKTAGRQ